MPKPLPHFQLKAEMARRGLKIADVARRAGIAQGTVSEILNGVRIAPDKLSSIRDAVHSFHIPKSAPLPQ